LKRKPYDYTTIKQRVQFPKEVEDLVIASLKKLFHGDDYYKVKTIADDCGLQPRKVGIILTQLNFQSRKRDRFGFHVWIEKYALDRLR
jgi:hypothetical protein